MTRFFWQRLSLIERVHWLRYFLPPFLAVIVVLYQLGVAQTLAVNFGHAVHYGVEIAFYSLVGPLVTWLTLTWVERSLVEKEQLEKQVQARTQQLASLTAVSADAILSVDASARVISWNQGAERMLGYPATKIVGHPLARLLPEAEVLAARLQEQGTIQGFETTACTRDGQTITVDLSQTHLTEATDTSPASLIIMRDVTARREREAIVEEERARIARDLHDSVAQTLYFLALKADMARQQLGQDPTEAEAGLQEISQKTRQVIRDVRRTIFALRPLDWTDGNFWPAMVHFVEGFAEQVGWGLTIDIDDNLSPIPPRLEPTVFRLVQESLNNVAKHADATRVWVTARSGEGGRLLELQVRDDGRGFETSTETNQGLGMNQMRARVSAEGGTLQLASQPGEGTIITAKMTLPGGIHE